MKNSKMRGIVAMVIMGAVMMPGFQAMADTKKASDKKTEAGAKSSDTTSGSDAAKTAPAALNVWDLDQAHSHVGFEVRHLGISKVKGTFTAFDATVQADQETGRITAIDASAKVESIDTGIAKRDAHLKGDDFFAVAKYPTIKAKLKSVSWSGSKFIADMDLTIRNVTKTVRFEGEHLGVQRVNFGAPQLRSGFEAHAEINRHDFGLTFNALSEGVAVVGDKVKITINIEIYRAL